MYFFMPLTPYLEIAASPRFNGRMILARRSPKDYCMPELNWSPAISVNVEVIDDQHKNQK